MAASQVQKLLDELANVLGQLGVLDEAGMAEEQGENPDGTPKNPEQNSVDPALEQARQAQYTELLERAENLKSQIAFYEAAAEKTKELRSVLERAAPAKTVETKEATVETRNYAVPKSHGNLKAFRDPETAYRAGMHLKGFVFGDAEARRWCYDHGVESRAQAGGVNSLGGVLTAPELANEIIRLVEEYGVYPQYAKRVTMTTDTLVYPRRTGGLVARPVGENAEVLTSDVSFDNVELNARIWGVANRTPNSLLEDSVINLADLLAVEVAQAFSEAFDNAGFIGDGSLSYHGVNGICTKIVGSSYTASVVTATGNSTFGDLTMKNFTDTLAKLPLFARNRNARWYISPSGWGAAMLRLAMLPGGASNAGGTNSNNVAAGFGESFLGYPVTLVQPMASSLSGTTGQVACLFGDLSQAAMFGERRAISIKTASERFIEYDQTLTFATTRNAMIVSDLGSTTKAGPVVALKFG